MKNIKTVRELLARIPVSWRDAEVAISDSISAVRAVRRVSLHENADGKRVVIIHETPVAIRGADTEDVE